MKSLITKGVLALVLLAATFGIFQTFNPPAHAVLSGAYQTVSYNAANFGTWPTSSMIWTPGTQNTYRYNVDLNNQMHLMIETTGGSISGTRASQFITVKIPENRTSVNTVTIDAKISGDNGNSGNWPTSYCLASAGSGLLYCRLSGLDFPVLTGTLRLDINTVLEVSDSQ